MRWVGAALVAAAAAVTLAASTHARPASTARNARPPGVKGVIVYPCTVDYPDGQFPELCSVGFSDEDTGLSSPLTNEKQLKTDPAWSPDGTRLAYVANGGDIYVHDVWDRWAGTSRRIGTGREPAWAPSGNSLAFSSMRTGNGDIYVVGAPGGDPRRLTTNPAAEDAPSWSPDGKTIAFDRGGDVWRIGADGKGERSLGAGSDPAWAPNGQELAFSYQGDIWVMNADGGARRNLTQTSQVAETKPAWAAGGRNLAFVGVPTSGGPADLYELPLGQHIRDLAVANDVPFAQLSLSWQHVRVLVETVSDRRPYVSVRDAYGHPVSVIHAGAFTLAFVDRSRHHGFAWSLGHEGYIGAWTVPFVGVRWPRLWPDAEDDFGTWKPRSVVYWDPAHPKERGRFRVVDKP